MTPRRRRKKRKETPKGAARCPKMRPPEGGQAARGRHGHLKGWPLEGEERREKREERTEKSEERRERRKERREKKEERS